MSKTEIFEHARPHLLGLAYRLLGTLAEAEDAVQDTYLKWQGIDTTPIRNAEAWLTTCCTNICLDVLKSARRSRTDYVGPWLPEPLHTRTERNQEEQLMLSSSLTTAFLLLLERLTPKERAAYLLHEVFDYSYSDIALTLEIKEVTCRKLVSRAKQYIGQEKARANPPREQQMALLTAFRTALETGEAGDLETLLSQSIELRADGGGKATAVDKVLSGQDVILEFVLEVLSPACQRMVFEITEINDALGMNILEDGEVIASATFSYGEDGKAENIFIMRNPDKLGHVQKAIDHDARSGGLRLH